MPQSLAQVFVHIIFSTKNRKPFIDEAIAPELFNYLGSVITSIGCKSIIVGGYEDHVHILCALSRTIAIMDLMEEVKKRSSKWIKAGSEQYNGFYWQDGYAVFSVTPQEAPAVVQYIEGQKAHHSQLTFQDECRMLFKRHKVEWDERYVWD